MKFDCAGRVYERITIEEFADRVRAFAWTRKITSFHLHHTADRHAAWRGVGSVHSTWLGHVRPVAQGGRGFRDLAMHALMDPEGYVWLGRDWNTPPASVAGRNGNAKAGPFMVECWGDFRRKVETGHPGDPWQGAQKENTETMCACICRQHALNPLDPNTVIGHKEVDKTACPGDIDLGLFEAQVAHRLASWGAPVAAAAPLPANIPAPPEPPPPPAGYARTDDGNVVRTEIAQSAIVKQAKAAKRTSISLPVVGFALTAIAQFVVGLPDFVRWGVGAIFLILLGIVGWHVARNVENLRVKMNKDHIA